MTQKEKAKAYDKVLINARMFYEDDHVSDDVNNLLEVLFPELTESEDERIRKELIQFIKNWKDSNNIGRPHDFPMFTKNVEQCDKYIAWLEKQGEKSIIIDIDKMVLKYSQTTDGDFGLPVNCQIRAYRQGINDALHLSLNLEKQGEQKSAEWHKGDEQNLNACLGYIPDEYLRRWLMDVIHVKYDKPTDKIEPKFHKGQWIVWQDECYKVNYNGCGYELVDKNGLSILLDYGTIDENAHLWNVAKDAKDGDVLVDKDDNIGIYEEIKGICWHSYIYLSFDNYLHGFSAGGSHVQNNTKPATKEQCDLLFQEMEEAGYMWDAEKKELKEIKNDYEPDTLIEESYQQQADDLIDMVTEKPVWSKEDENQCINTIELVKNANDCAGILDKETALNWLKSLKEKAHPKNTWKPSDEQMKALEHFVRSIGESGYVSPYDNNTKLLYSLLNDLKKLKR